MSSFKKRKMIATGQLRRGQVHPVKEGYTRVNVTSSNRGLYGQLSPMKLGPFLYSELRVINDYYPDGVHPGFYPDNIDLQVAEVQVMENLWQYSKIYSVDIEDGEVQESFFLRRQKGMKDPKPYRRVYPKKSSVSTVAAYWNGQVVDYLDSRKYYCRLYEQLVLPTAAWEDLQERHQKGENLLIVGYDANTCDMNHKSIQSAYTNGEHAFGHELVRCYWVVSPGSKKLVLTQVLLEENKDAKLGFPLTCYFPYSQT